MNLIPNPSTKYFLAKNPWPNFLVGQKIDANLQCKFAVLSAKNSDRRGEVFGLQSDVN